MDAQASFTVIPELKRSVRYVNFHNDGEFRSLVVTLKHVE